MYYENTLLGAVDAIFAVNDQMGVELMGAAKWNGLKRAVTKVTADALRKSNPTNSSWSNKIISAVSKIKSQGNTPKSIREAMRPSSYLHGFDYLCDQLFGINYELGEELLGSIDFGVLGRKIKNATHDVLNAGSKVPYISDAVADVRSVANIFKKSSSANDSANALVDSASTWIKNNKLKIALVGGGTVAAIYFLTRKRKRK